MVSRRNGYSWSFFLFFFNIFVHKRYSILCLGSIYVEMISNLVEPILRNPSINFVRYNTFHSIPTGTNNLIGRAAHIAILDSELFVEKFILVSAAKYFKW